LAWLNQPIIEVHVSPGQVGTAARRHPFGQIHEPGKLEDRISGKSVSKFVRQPIQVLFKDAGFALDDTISY
jgi:hypothetical protein